jgi:phosphatidylglycerophosphate synthase
MTASNTQESFKLNRFLSQRFTTLFLKTSITPNQVTSLSLVFGIFSGFLFSRGNYPFSVLGALAFQIAVTLDNCDGEIARSKKLKSVFGGWFDVIADVLVDIALFSGITLGLLRAKAQGPLVPLGVLCILGCLINFLIVILQKIKGFGPAVYNQKHPTGTNRKNIIYQIIDALREGDSSWFVMLFVFFNQSKYLLWFASFYIQVLWISALFLNFKWIFAAPLKNDETSESFPNGRLQNLK